jgi:hypothetical protein
LHPRLNAANETDGETEKQRQCALNTSCRNDIWNDSKTP